MSSSSQAAELPAAPAAETKQSAEVDDPIEAPTPEPSEKRPKLETAAPTADTTGPSTSAPTTPKIEPPKYSSPITQEIADETWDKIQKYEAVRRATGWDRTDDMIRVTTSPPVIGTITSNVPSAPTSSSTGPPSQAVREETGTPLPSTPQEAFPAASSTGPPSEQEVAMTQLEVTDSDRRTRSPQW